MGAGNRQNESRGEVADPSVAIPARRGPCEFRRGCVVPREPNSKKLTVYYDGQCPMCSAIMDSVRNSAKVDDFFSRPETAHRCQGL